MAGESEKFKEYFSHLTQISFLGRIYKKYISSPVLLSCTRQFGGRVMEVGCGIGSGVLGAYPEKVTGLDINTEVVEYCQSMGLKAQLIGDDGIFPVKNNQFDSCVLDNVLEHVSAPAMILDECYRVTKQGGGLIIVVPGEAGYRSDLDHKVFYDEERLKTLDARWKLLNLFSIPFFFKNKKISRILKQYCLVVVYKKLI